ncbi:MAG: hypothetical protein J2P37_07020 [Ktedonobacteraceae bacterium]|nr:hypothetical protein [Ktedonobacteraceae bacterium]MBO0790586.1 hypothetical protein [Ktedonobacteraceae bacterium]
MNLIVLDVYPVPQWIEVGGQVAAIVILLFLSIFVLLSVALNLVMAFLFAWLRGKSEVIKKIRPRVVAVNEASESAMKGVPPAEDEGAAIKVAAAIPVNVRKADEKVEQVSGRVADAVIEFRARTVQAKTIVKAFLMPGLLVRERRPHGQDLASKSPGYRELMQESSPEEPVEPPASEGYEQTVPSGQLKHASSR